MDPNLVELSIRDFRAIKEADIALNGITVMSGLNGCGKSTVSKLFYYIFKYANDFETLSQAETLRRMSPYISVLQQIQIPLQLYSLHANKEQNRKPSYNINLSDISNPAEYIKHITILCNDFLMASSTPNTRIDQILKATLSVQNNISTKEMLELLIARVRSLFTNKQELDIERPTKLLEMQLYSLIRSKIPESDTVSIKEYGTELVGTSIDNIGKPHVITNAIYIDTPMSIWSNKSRQDVHDYWNDLNELIHKSDDITFKHNINKEIERIIQGEVYVDDDTGQLKYKMNNGKVIDILDSASGIRSFAVLTRLIKSGVIGEHTLLIIDEPEVHLHPQWIVEYARILVLLHKELGVKLLLASHSTDMVSAIRYIAKKEQCIEKVQFYIAEETETQGQYKFQSTGIDINPIFKIFNKSYDKLEKYGTDRWD